MRGVIHATGGGGQLPRCKLGFHQLNIDLPSLRHPLAPVGAFPARSPILATT